MPFRYIAGDNGIVNALDDLIRRALVKITQRNDRKAAHADILGKQFFRRTSACFFELHILGKGQRKHGDRDIPSRQIGGYFT